MDLSRMPFAFMFLVSTVFLTACASKPPPAPPPPPRLIDDSHPRATLILGSTGLAGFVTLGNVRIGQNGAFPKAAVDIRNLTDRRFDLEYRVVWFDRDGFPIQEDMAVWHPFSLTPHQIRTMTTQAKDPEAYKIRFTLRFPDDPMLELDRKRIMQEMNR